MYITFTEYKTRLSLIKEDEYGLVYTRHSDRVEPYRGTGHTRLEFSIYSKKRANKDGGGSQSVAIYLANVYSSVVVNNSATELLIYNFKEGKLYDFKPIPKDVLSRAVLSKLPLSGIWDNYKVKNLYKPIFEYKNEFIDLESTDYKPSERSRYELLSIDLFMDKDENWSVSPSSATKYRTSMIDGKKYKRLTTYLGDDMKHLESIDFSNDTYFGQYYNIILNYFDLIKT